MVDNLVVGSVAALLYAAAVYGTEFCMRWPVERSGDPSSEYCYRI